MDAKKFLLTTIPCILFSPLYTMEEGAAGRKKIKTTEPITSATTQQVKPLRFQIVYTLAKDFENKKIGINDIVNLPEDLYDYIFLLLTTKFNIEQALLDTITNPGKFSIDITHDLIKAGANLKTTSAEGNSYLFYAVAYNQPDRIQLLLDYGADINQANDEGITPLIKAIDKVNFALTMLLLERGANINQADVYGTTPLMHAIRKDSIPLVQLLLKHNAQVNQPDDDNLSALIYAIISNKPHALAIIHLLLDRKADVNYQDELGYTPLIYAIRKESTIKATVLLHRGAIIDLPDSQGRTALFHAIANPLESNMVNFLLDQGANVNKRDDNNTTPLMYAAQNNNIDAAIFLLGHKALKYPRNNDNQTALDIAKAHGFELIADFLK